MSGMPRVGDQFGAYQITGEIGRGGMGVVYLANQSGLNRPVALKILDATLAADPQFMARFHHEATLLARLDSPHVVQVYDHGSIGGCVYLAMQYVPGGDLSGLLRTRGALGPAEALSVFEDICAALEDAHGRGIVHRDVKPSNVLLRRAGDPSFAYLCDFGIAQSADTNLTQTGAVAGTWAFLAPERFDGRPATPQSDIYSAGCVLWVMLTGQNPYAGTDLQQAMGHARAPIPVLPGNDGLTAGLNRLLQACLAKDPLHRPATARAAAEAAASLRQGISNPATDATRLRPVVTPPPPPPVTTAYPQPAQNTTPTPLPVAAPPARGRRWAFLVAGFAALALVATAGALIVTNWIGGGQSSTAATAGRHTAEPAVTVTTGAPGTQQPATSAPAGQASSYTCWDGSQTATIDGCSAPKGSIGMKYLFPQLQDPSAGCVQKYYDDHGTTFECPVGDATVRYVYWNDPSWAAHNFEDLKYADIDWTPFVVDGIQNGRQWRTYLPNGKGQYLGSALWVYNQFSFTVLAYNTPQRDELMNTVRVRAADQVQGFSNDVGAREGAIG